MTVTSMTGYARVEGRLEGVSWVWELRSVNGKSLDLRLRLPNGYDAIEASLRAMLGEALKRGTVNVTLSMTDDQRPAMLRLNREVLDQVIALMQELEGRIDAAPPRLDGLLSIRGVMELAEAMPDPADREIKLAAVTASFGEAVIALAGMRRVEGIRLAEVLETRLAEIEAMVHEAEQSAAAQPAAIRDRFRQQIATLLDNAPPLPEERLAQEVALLIQRADVREELDRLTAHVAATRELLAEGSGVGRRLDFLCQEFNREANTLCSKSVDLGLTRIGLGLKAAIEQLREQVQNIE
ncbi:MAG TPA: YicC/YloC family endoribonuclease [Stellaceae bacterium]|nr:YicC/YloC family endoribonuclease [Stellaceae bacterium]